jgi:hypothetical protein
MGIILLLVLPLNREQVEQNKEIIELLKENKKIIQVKEES